MVKHGAVAQVGDCETFLDVLPSESPKHPDDFVTLVTAVGGDRKYDGGDVCVKLLCNGDWPATAQASSCER